MNRRTALKHTALLMGGAVFLPSCGFDPERPSVILTHLDLNAKLQEVLAQVVDAMIPSGDVPGALDLGVPAFVLMMVDECVRREDQELFSTGLEQFNRSVKKRFGKTFSKGDSSFRDNVLVELMVDAGVSEVGQSPEARAIDSFLQLTKRYTIMGYMESEYMMTEQFPYKHIPGPFHACVPIYSLKA